MPPAFARGATAGKHPAGRQQPPVAQHRGRADGQQQPEERIECGAALDRPLAAGRFELAECLGARAAQIAFGLVQRVDANLESDLIAFEDLGEPARCRRDELHEPRARKVALERPHPQTERRGRLAIETDAHPFADAVVPALGPGKLAAAHLDEIRDQDRPVRRADQIRPLEIEVEEERRVGRACRGCKRPDQRAIASRRKRVHGTRRQRDHAGPDDPAQRDALKQRMALLEHERPDQIFGRPVTGERCRRPAKARLPYARRHGVGEAGLKAGPYAYGVQERQMSGAALNDSGERAKGLLQRRPARVRPSDDCRRPRSAAAARPSPPRCPTAAHRPRATRGRVAWRQGAEWKSTTYRRARPHSARDARFPVRARWRPSLTADTTKHAPRGRVGIVPHGQRESRPASCRRSRTGGHRRCRCSGAARRPRPMSRRGRCAPTCRRAGGR